MPNGSDAPPAVRRRWWVLAAVCQSILLVGIDNTIVNVALPTLEREIDATTTQLQWVVDDYAMVFAGLLLTVGNLGHRIGRKHISQAGLVLFAAASIYPERSSR